MRELGDAAYVPGTWVAISAANGCLLVDLVAADPVVRRCWKLLTEDAGADAVLDALVGGGVAATPSFALVVRSAEGQHRAVVRHPASLTVHGVGSDQVEIDSADGVSWTDVVLTDASLDAVTLTGEPADASVELPMGAGVTMASVVHLRQGTPSATVVEQTPARPAPAPAPPAAAAPEREEKPAPPPPPPPLTTPPPPPPPAVVEANAAGDDADESYDHLFGASIQRPVTPEAASPRPAPQPPAPVSGHTAGWHTEAPPVVRDEPAPTPAATPAATSDGLIEGVPWAQSDTSESAGPTPPPPVVESRPAETRPDTTTTSVPYVSDEQSEYGATVNRAQLRADAHAAAGPTVLAGQCPNGHLSPPHADRCRVCRAPMPEQEPFEIARPVLGNLRLPSGDLVTLDRGVLLGRSPDVPNGLDRPHVLRLKSPDNDISRNHAEVVLDGWNVSVRDLGSTNGTVVQLPGRAPVRLRENEPALLENAATITLADEITIVFEVQP